MNRNQRMSKRHKAEMAESLHYKIKENRTHSGKQIIATVCRPMPNGFSKIVRKSEGHTWSLKTKSVTTKWGKQKKIRMYQKWTPLIKDTVKVIPSLMDNM